MLYIELIKQYWLAQDALRVIKTLNINELPQNLQETISTAKPQLELTIKALEAEFARWDPKQSVFNEVEMADLKSKPIMENIAKLMTISDFNSLFSPLKEMRNKFYEFLEQENKFRKNYSEFKALQPAMDSVIDQHFQSYAVDDNGDEWSLSDETPEQLKYKSLLAEYGSVDTPVQLDVGTAISLSSRIEDTAAWLQTKIMSDEFKNYLDHLTQWTINLNKLEYFSSQLQENLPNLKLSNEQMKAVKFFNDKRQQPMQRLSKFGLFGSEFAKIMLEITQDPKTNLLMQAVKEHLKSQTSLANDAQRNSDLYEDLIRETKELKEQIKDLMNQYPTETGWHFISRKPVAKLNQIICDALEKFIVFCDAKTLQLQQTKPLKVSDEEKAAFAHVRGKLCSELQEVYVACDNALEKNSFVLEKKRDEVMRSQVGPILNQFYKPSDFLVIDTGGNYGVRGPEKR